MVIETTTQNTIKPVLDLTKAIKVSYTNWRNETTIRTIIPSKIWWGSTEWYKDEQWLLDVWDVEKEAVRTYAMKNIREWQ